MISFFGQLQIPISYSQSEAANELGADRPVFYSSAEYKPASIIPLTPKQLTTQSNETPTILVECENVGRREHRHFDRSEQSGEISNIEGTP